MTEPALSHDMPLLREAPLADALRAHAITALPRDAHGREAMRNRALGAYLGLAIGDALGATVEFMTPREIAQRYGTHDRMIGGGWLKLKPGQVTDDTTMALALGDALIERGGFDAHCVAEHYVRWLRSKPVDCGNTCRRGIQRFIAKGSVEGPQSDGDGGNGAAMRNLPVAIAFAGQLDALTSHSIAQGRVTHHHPLSDAATVALAHMISVLILGGTREQTRAIADALVAQHREFRFAPYPGRATGYVVDTMQTVFHHYFEFDGFEAAVIPTVNRGDDADTTGALVAMLAGAACGARALPERWLGKLDHAVAAQIERQTDALLAIAHGEHAGAHA